MGGCGVWEGGRKWCVSVCEGGGEGESVGGSV